MDQIISLAVIKRRTTQDGQLIATAEDWQMPFVIVLGIWARFISPRQLEETALALRIRHAVLRWIKLVLFLFPLFSKLPAWIYNRDSRPSQSRVSADRVAPRNAAVNKAKRRICYVESSLASERDIRLLEIQPSTKGSTIHDDRKNRLPRRRSRFGGAFLYMGKLWEKFWHLLQQTRIFVNVNLKRLCNRSESPQRILTLWIDAICID